MLPDDIKKSLDDQEAEIVGKMAKITEVVNKVKNFKTEGKTDEEVLAFLTAAEKEARMLSKGTTPPTPQVNL